MDLPPGPPLAGPQPQAKTTPAQDVMSLASQPNPPIAFYVTFVQMPWRILGFVSNKTDS